MTVLIDIWLFINYLNPYLLSRVVHNEQMSCKYIETYYIPICPNKIVSSITVIYCVWCNIYQFPRFIIMHKGALRSNKYLYVAGLV